jgi:cbb3-type cytochrome oxidase maturation protein
MNIIYVLIPLALLLLVAAVAAFLWAVRNAQFDDLDSPATRILFDDDELLPPPPSAPATDAAKETE